MMIAIALAGYSWLDADMLRKAMGKKIPEVMEAEKEKLMKGFVEFGKLTPTLADKIWKLIEPFAAYGFNKAHAASYGRVAYQTAYMKANFPEEYMSAVLTADSGDTEKISETIHECERMGIEVLPPDINESFAAFSVVPLNIVNSAVNSDGSISVEGAEKSQMRGATNELKEVYENTVTEVSEEVTKQLREFQPVRGRIRFGLTTIKNFGEGIAEAIIEERKKSGHFKSLTDFLLRVHDKNLNKKSLEALICSGAFDRFAERGVMYANVENLLSFNREHVAGKEANQNSLFGGIDSSLNTLTMTPAPDVPKSQKLLWEKELLGVYVSGHPLDSFKEELAKRTTVDEIKRAVREKLEIETLRMKGTLVTAGMIETVKELLTKKGDRMAFIQLASLTDTVEMVAFPEVFQNHKDLLVPGTCVAIKGKLSIRNDEPSILVDRIKGLATEIT
jgi:DNA polymerase-3 subunit alpha